MALMGLPLTSPTQLTWYQNAKKSCAPCRNRIKLKVLEAPQSQQVFFFASNLHKWVPNHSSEHYPPKEKNAEVRDLAPMFGDLNPK